MSYLFKLQTNDSLIITLKKRFKYYVKCQTAQKDSWGENY